VWARAHTRGERDWSIHSSASFWSLSQKKNIPMGGGAGERKRVMANLNQRYCSKVSSLGGNWQLTASSSCLIRMIPGILGCLEVSYTLKVLEEPVFIRDQFSYCLCDKTPLRKSCNRPTFNSLLRKYMGKKIYLLSTSASYIQRAQCFCIQHFCSAVLKSKTF